MPLARHDTSAMNSPTILQISTHMPLARHDIYPVIMLHFSFKFLLTCLLRGMTIHESHVYRHEHISTHMPLARHDICYGCGKKPDFISTHMPLARHDGVWIRRHKFPDISTHMPLARHDIYPIQWMTVDNNFYSHASCEAWLPSGAGADRDNTFLLTCLLRGMTGCMLLSFISEKFLLTCLLRGMTLMSL